MALIYQDEGLNEEGEADYKTDQKFAEHMRNNPSAASSDFARKKTYLQQRRYLPAFAVRQEVSPQIFFTNAIRYFR
jgi:pre-mRNA-splicing factor ATP-dependent RNA helicase DHX38/PRP16